MDVPDGWWLFHTTTNLLLAVLVHRCNPDITDDPTTVPTGPTREFIRKESQNKILETRERDRIVEQYSTNRQRVEDSMLNLKAKLMAQTIDTGTINQIEKQLALLSQFKESFVKVQNRIHGKGEDDFDETAHELLSELPFMKKRRIDGAGTNSEISNLTNS
jgi:hypothetical protein